MFFETILNLIYPNSCGICDKISKKSLCKKCEMNIKKHEINKFVDYRNNKEKYFDYSFSIFKYEDIIRKKIIEYKFGDKSYLYKFFSEVILKNEKTFGLFKIKYDIIIPVPIHKKRKQLRGYNQTKLIAREIASKTANLNFEDQILLKKKNTEPQSMLSKSARENNVKNVFEINNKYANKIVNKKIILFDDIYTTGSTVNECSRILKNNGAKEVFVLTIAKD